MIIFWNESCLNKFFQESHSRKILTHFQSELKKKRFQFLIHIYNNPKITRTIREVRVFQTRHVLSVPQAAAKAPEKSNPSITLALPPRSVVRRCPAPVSHIRTVESSLAVATRSDPVASYLVRFGIGTKQNRYK